MNNLIVALTFADLMIVGLIKLRSMNGYMEDDQVLTAFCIQWRVESQIEKVFRRGVDQTEGMEETESNYILPDVEVFRGRKIGGDKTENSEESETAGDKTEESRSEESSNSETGRVKIEYSAEESSTNS